MGDVGCRRTLDNNVLAKIFVQQILGRFKEYEDPVAKIVREELALKKLEDHPTITHVDYRDPEYQSNEERDLLRKKILMELIDEVRLEDDDQIELGKGGAKPQDAKRDRIAYIVSGSPASGKSKIAEHLAEDSGAYILDSDYAKRKFPEYYAYHGGASLVHEESDRIVFATDESVFEYCVTEGYNIVIPLVGKTYRSCDKICKSLIRCGYKIHILNVALDRFKCVARAYERFERTNRYVPLSYIFDEVGNEPELVYFQIKRTYQGDTNIVSFSQVSTDVAPGELPKILEATENSPVHAWLE